MTDRDKAVELLARGLSESFFEGRGGDYTMFKEEATALLDQIAPLLTAQAVKVKPLVWHNFDVFTYWAESTSGTYRVEERHGWWRCTLNLPRIEHLVYEYKSDGSHDSEAAIAAAQADFNARILSAVEAVPVAQAVAEEREQCAKVAEGCPAEYWPTWIAAAIRKQEGRG